MAERSATLNQATKKPWETQGLKDLNGYRSNMLVTPMGIEPMLPP